MVHVLEEKLKLAEYEKEQLIKKLLEKQLRGDIVKGLIIPVGSLIVALLGVLSGVYSQYIGSQATIQAATLSSQQTGYAKLITALDTALYAKKENQLMTSHIDKFRQAYYELELMIKPDVRDQFMDELEQLTSFLLLDQEVTNEYMNKFNTARQAFRSNLQNALEKDYI